jgi:acyl carrier protein
VSADVLTIQSAVTDIITEVLGELDLESDEPIDSPTRLIADLGFASVDFIQLIVELEGHFQRKFGFHDLIMPNGHYVADLTVGELVTFIQHRLESASFGAPSAVSVRSASLPTPQTHDEPTLAPEDLSAFRGLLPLLSAGGEYPKPSFRNPPAAFILSAPRSGSTLLRVILAGNPSLFAPPELYLLSYLTMAQREAALSNKLNEHLLTGTIRAIMRLRSCGAQEAEEFLRSCEYQQMPTRDFYALLQELLRERLLVDKTPVYPMHPEILRRAEEDFDSPLYVHLVRHPCGMIRSFEDARIEQLIPFMRESNFSRRQLAELTWLVANENVANFFAALPPERCLLVRYEDLVREPESPVRRICDFLGVPFIREMLAPYKDQNMRMTDGLSRAAEFGGDLKFHLHHRIEPEAADRWRKYESESSLSQMSRNLAASFGY